MSPQPNVSIVLPTYNAARFLPETLASILAQDYPDLELIVVDDGSTDDTERVVLSHAGDRKRRVRYVREEHSGGPSRPRNRGIAEAAGRWIFFFDSDDVMLPGKLSSTVAMLQREPAIGLVFTDFEKIDETGRSLQSRFLAGYPRFQGLGKQPRGDGAFVIQAAEAYRGLLEENYIGTSSVAIPRRVLQHLGGFDETLPNSEDRDLWFRLTKSHPVGFIDRVYHRYRVRRGSILQASALELSPGRIRVLQRQLTPDLPAGSRRVIRTLLAENQIAMGYEYQCRGELGRALHSYLAAFRQRPGWLPIRGTLGAALRMTGIVPRTRGSA